MSFLLDKLHRRGGVRYSYIFILTKRRIVMKKLLGVIAFLSVFTLFACNNDSEKSDDSVFEGFGIELDSEIKPNTSRLIPIKN